MHICPSCGTGFQDDEEFCLDCGLKLTTGEFPGHSGDPAHTSIQNVHPSAQAGAGTTPPAGRLTGVQDEPVDSGRRATRNTIKATAKSAGRTAGGTIKSSDSVIRKGRKVDSPASLPAANPPVIVRGGRPRPPDPTTDRLMRYRPVYKAPDEWTAVTIKELLCSAGLNAQVLPVAEPFDNGLDRLIEGYWGKVLVLESDLEDACRLIADYLRGLDRSMH